MPWRHGRYLALPARAPRQRPDRVPGQGLLRGRDLRHVVRLRRRRRERPLQQCSDQHGGQGHGDSSPRSRPPPCAHRHSGLHSAKIMRFPIHPLVLLDAVATPWLSRGRGFLRCDPPVR